MIRSKWNGYNPDGTRLLFKGGDGGAGQLRADEAARQQKIQAAVDAINRQFGSGPAMAAPTAAQFTSAGTPAVAAQPAYSMDVGREETRMMPAVAAQAGTPGGLDQAAFDAAMAKFQSGENAGASRQAMYDDLSGAVTGVAVADLDKQFSKASKQNLFGLARYGLLGGSADAESGADLGERYGEGRIRATNAGLGAAADLKSTDERTRQNLISLAQSGIDTGTAESLAASQTAAAAQAAKAAVPATSIGDLFSNLGQAYMQNTALQARYPNGLPQQQGSSPFAKLFSGKGYSGTVTS